MLEYSALELEPQEFLRVTDCTGALCWLLGTDKVPVGAKVESRWFLPGVQVMFGLRRVAVAGGFCPGDASQALLDNWSYFDFPTMDAGDDPIRSKLLADLKAVVAKYAGEQAPTLARCLSDDCQCNFPMLMAGELRDVWEQHEFGMPFSSGSCPLCSSASELRRDYVWAQCRWPSKYPATGFTQDDLMEQVLKVVENLQKVLHRHNLAYRVTCTEY